MRILCPQKRPFRISQSQLAIATSLIFLVRVGLLASTWMPGKSPSHSTIVTTGSYATGSSTRRPIKLCAVGRHPRLVPVPPFGSLKYSAGCDVDPSGSRFRTLEHRLGARSADAHCRFSRWRGPHCQCPVLSRRHPRLASSTFSFRRGVVVVTSSGAKGAERCLSTVGERPVRTSGPFRRLLASTGVTSSRFSGSPPSSLPDRTLSTPAVPHESRAGYGKTRPPCPWHLACGMPHTWPTQPQPPAR